MDLNHLVRRSNKTQINSYPGCPSSLSIMPPSRSRGKERPYGPSLPGACANMSSSSSLMTTSSESFPPRTNGGSTLQLNPVEKASITRRGCGSGMTSMPLTSLNCVRTLKTPPSQLAYRVSKEASYPASIPLSPNYFDVLSKVEDAPTEGILERERESPGIHRALALSRDPKEKPPCLFRTRQRRQRKRSCISRFN